VRCLRAWAENDSEESQAFVAAMRRWRGPRAGGPLDGLWTGTAPVWRTIPALEPAHPLDTIAARSGLQASLAVPVNADDSRAALEFFSRNPIGVDREVEGFMRSIASQLAQYLRRKQVERDLRHVANHDSLTGLAGRPLLHERMTHAIQRATRHRRRFAVLFMDLDRFKHVNDSLGHSAGDALLVQCANRLRECVRACDTVARFGGDEFVVVLEDLHDVADAISPLTKILNHLSAPFEVQGRELMATASVGVSLFPDDGHDVETLLMNADAAMYRAKEKGSGTYHFYSAQMNEQGQERLVLETGLHRALEREELFLVYQPKLELTTGRITGVEALMRWRHPTLGLIPPAQFIPIAEDNGLIDVMGRWALEVACRDARRWQDEGHPVRVSVNLSPRQLNRAELAQEVSQVLAAARLAPEQLEIEITESGVMRNPTRAAAQLLELRALGVSLAIDDFGTGYSSLSYLRRFPLDTLKIDRSFIKDLPGDEDAAGLTAGIIALAHRLRMTVVAEGVETLEQLGFLRAQRCDQIQGFYLSKPIAADEISRFLERDVRNFVGPTVAA
jgi:diguanylate cyclase (GGDEF)-like protein